MKVTAAVLAAGRSERFGSDKTEALLGDRPVWLWSVEAFLNHPAVDRILVVSTTAKAPDVRARLGPDVHVIVGGHSRQDSSRAAVEQCEPGGMILIHDAARPFVSSAVVTRVIEAVARSGAAAAALPVTDTIKEVSSAGVRTLDRAFLVAMQTPQGALVDLLLSAHRQAAASVTDEMALLESQGVRPEIVAGEAANFKITTPEDLARARGLLGTPETRIGIGYDVHPFSDEPDRQLFLGGVHFPGHRALAGHSDADALLHAVTDALLGAAALGDIGEHFPNTDPRWRGEPSSTFLRHAAGLLEAAGWRVSNVDATVIAESPKIMKMVPQIRSAIAEALGIEVGRVSVKATTNERLGAIGRGEGIAAFATACISGFGMRRLDEP